MRGRQSFVEDLCRRCQRLAGASPLPEEPDRAFVPRGCPLRPSVDAPVPALPWPEERTFAPVPPLVRVVLDPRTVALPTVRLRTLVRVDTPVLTATPARRFLTTTA